MRRARGARIIEAGKGSGSQLWGLAIVQLLRGRVLSPNTRPPFCWWEFRRSLNFRWLIFAFLNLSLSGNSYPTRDLAPFPFRFRSLYRALTTSTLSSLFRFSNGTYVPSRRTLPPPSGTSHGPRSPGAGGRSSAGACAWNCDPAARKCSARVASTCARSASPVICVCNPAEPPSDSASSVRHGVSSSAYTQSHSTSGSASAIWYSGLHVTSGGGGDPPSSPSGALLLLFFSSRLGSAFSNAETTLGDSSRAPMSSRTAMMCRTWL